MTPELNDILLGRLRKAELLAFLEKNPDLFEETIKVCLGDIEPQSWRAAWLVYHYMDDNDPQLHPYLDAILERLPAKGDGHQRELLKIIDRMKLDEEQESMLFDICFTIWEEIDKSPSPRGMAFLILLKMAQKYPELKNEISHLTQPHYMDTLSPGIKHSMNKILRKLNWQED